MSHPTRRWVAALALVLAFAACGKKDDGGQGAAKPPAPAPDPAAALAALLGSDAPAPGALEPPPSPPEVRVEGEAEPLRVAAAVPRGRVGGAVRISITFSKPVRPLGAADEGDPPARLTPAVKGRWRWLGSSTVEFVAAEPFPLATAFHVRVPAGLTAIDGGRLAEEYAWSFETPRVQPIGGDPVSRWRAYRWAASDQVFEVTFSQRPREASLAEKVHIGGPFGTTIPVAVISVETPREKAVREARERGQPPPPEPAGPDAPGFGDADHRVHVRLRPTRPLERDTDYELVFPPGIESAEGPLASEKEHRWKFRTYGPLAVTFVGCHRWHGACPDGPLTLHLSNPVKSADLKAALHMEPPVELRWSDDDRAEAEWVLHGDFRPATRYRVTVAAGLPDAFGQTLAADHTAPFTTGDYEPYLDVWQSEALLERGLRAALPMTHVNTPAATVRWARLTPDSIIPYLDSPWRKEPPPGGFRALVRRLDGARNARLRSPLDLDPLFAEAPDVPGRLALVKVTAAHEPDERGRPIVVQVTDLGVFLKSSPADTRVFVWRLSTGEAAGGARVELVDETGRRVAEAVTAADGVAALPGVASLPPVDPKKGHPSWRPPFLAARVTLGDDVAFATTEDVWQLAPYRFDLEGDWEGAPPRAEGLVFTDRGIYRPGDELHVKGILRERSVGRLRTPAGRSVRIALTDPEGETLQEVDGTLSAFGGVDARFRLPADGRLGAYGVRITDPTTRLSWSATARVAEYRPPEFLVDVNVHDETRFDGDPVRAVIEGRYLFGAAMSGAEVKWVMHAREGSFEPAKADGFVFGRRAIRWDDEEAPADGRLVASGAWTLDDEGRHVVDAGPADTPEDRPQVFTVEAAVTDVNRQVVAGRTSFPVHPASFYVGLKGPSGFASAGKPFTVAVVAVAPGDERRVADVPVEVKLVRQEWHTVKKRTLAGTFETVSERRPVDVGTCKVATNARLDAPASCEFTPDRSGYHEIVATAVDERDRRTVTTDGLWVTGEGYAAWLQDDDHRVEVVSDRAVYDVGDTATLLVQSPFPEAEAWVTLEREGVLKQQRIRLRGTATPIRVPIDASMIPNVFVGVVLVRGRVEPPGKPGDPGRPAYRVGYRELRVVPAEKTLRVEVRPDAAEKRPGSDLAVDVAVADRRGAGVKAEVTVWAVDEGVLALTGYETPDPVAALHRPRGLSVRQSTNLAALVPQLRYGEKGREQGGGGGASDSMTLRRRFVTTPLFVGAVVTDDVGRARVTGRLPDNLTTFRIMAVAVTAEDRGGRGESKVVVNKPLMARPALPRAVRAGDRFAAGMVVHAREGGAGGSVPVHVRAEVEGPIEALEPLARDLTVPVNRGVEVRFAFRAKEGGRDDQARLRFVVEGGGASDAVEARLPVRLPVASEAVATHGDLAGGDPPVVEALQTPGGVRSDAGGLELSLASTALVGLGADAERLIDYPYGCLEQQASRLVPFVALRSLLDRYGRDWLGDRSPSEIVEKSVAAIVALQRPDGGFGYWPGSRCSTYWASAYATLALGEAQAVGHAVPPTVLVEARRYLRERLDDAAACEWGRRSDEERAFGAYVLARQGDPPREPMRRLFDRREGMALFGRALLAHAWALVEPEGGRARTLIDGIMNAARVTPSEVHFEESHPETYAALFHSDTRTTGIVLQALLAVEPEHPFVPKIARYLLKIRGDGTYRNTQEAGFSLMALSDYARIREGETPDLRAVVRLGAKALVDDRLRGRELAAHTRKISMADLGAAGGAQRLTFSAEGTGRLYYGALLRYLPAEMPTTARDDGLVVQRWYEPLGREGQTRSVTEGDLVRVHLRVATPQARHYVAVADPLPSGLEAVDTSLETTARLTESAADEDGVDEESGSAALDGRSVGWYSPFDHVEMRDDRVLLFADRLPPGVHAFSYVARATTAGTFRLPPARAEEMYTPEVSGRSDGGTFWIHPRAAVGQR